MRQSLSKVGLILLALLAACNAEPDRQSEPSTTQDAPGSATGDPAVVHHPEPPARPAEHLDSVQVEGTWERFTAKLVQPAAEPPFSAYVPPDMIFEQASSGEGDGYYFFTNFAGKRNDNAFVLVFVYPAGTSEPEAQRRVQAFMASRKAKSSEGSRFTFEQNGVMYAGGIELKQQDGRFYHVADQYPREYGDGFGPRAAFIKRNWVWLKSGDSL